ncbi:hypothetical protein P5F75_14700, partial [Caldifermentibacillus hisashii]|uniref:hypothetical protein n=1 Tax=Caldifermentibacillus hisashii TaxID=996558 RepID=UPI002E23BB65|nr:hypothetical protein [Caldifermentibacillus hisashii]
DMAYSFFTQLYGLNRREQASSPKNSISLPKMATRFGFVVKIERFSPQNGDENTFRRQNWAFPAPKWRRDSVSSSKIGFLLLKLVTRFGLVVKIECFSPQIGDENTFRRQNWAFPAPKWRRDSVSSSKIGFLLPKMATRFGFVVKIERFLPQIGDEIRPRRQK